MGTSASKKEQRAADIRDALYYYQQAGVPYGRVYRAEAVYDGVQRNNQRKERSLCSWLFDCVVAAIISYIWLAIEYNFKVTDNPNQLSNLK